MTILGINKHFPGSAEPGPRGNGRTLSFDPRKDFIDLPGGRNKFTLRRDPATRRYWSLVNKETDPPVAVARRDGSCNAA